MQNWTGARWVGPDPDRQVLLTGVQLAPRGRWEYTYSLTPGVLAHLVLPAGPTTLPPDDPAVVAVVRDLEEAQRGYTGPDH